jgi:hypothetical protein
MKKFRNHKKSNYNKNTVICSCLKNKRNRKEIEKGNKKEKRKRRNQTTFALKIEVWA